MENIDMTANDTSVLETICKDPQEELVDQYNPENGKTWLRLKIHRETEKWFESPYTAREVLEKYLKDWNELPVEVQEQKRQDNINRRRFQYEQGVRLEKVRAKTGKTMDWNTPASVLETILTEADTSPTKAPWE